MPKKFSNRNDSNIQNDELQSTKSSDSSKFLVPYAMSKQVRNRKSFELKSDSVGNRKNVKEEYQNFKKEYDAEFDQAAVATTGFTAPLTPVTRRKSSATRRKKKHIIEIAEDFEQVNFSDTGDASSTAIRNMNYKVSMGFF